MIKKFLERKQQDREQVRLSRTVLDPDRFLKRGDSVRDEKIHHPHTQRVFKAIT